MKVGILFFGAPPRTPYSFRGAAPYPVRFLERKRSKELAFLIWRVLLFLRKGHKINKEQETDTVKYNFIA